MVLIAAVLVADWFQGPNVALGSVLVVVPVVAAIDGSRRTTVFCGTLALAAFVVRMTLVPAALALLGECAWRLPGWLDRVLPHVDIEGGNLPDPAPAPHSGERPVPAPAHEHGHH
ncbi:hypothetical protein [Streptomyces sp. CMB-StM0423]|uniref:hypothetical protein n=1 Tax=Streptomyces sp. CMB-StM0423 TaxID=2059884 RepID=UPI000C7091F1|nr:hypothetical protein CXR04_00445 [Streptomyces sp. CMB-StM0423]